MSLHLIVLYIYIYIYIYIYNRLIGRWVECSPMVRETWVQSKDFKNGTLCLILSNTRYVSRVKWSNQGKGVEPLPTPRCCSYWKGSLWVPLDYGRQLYLYRYIFHIRIYIYIYMFAFTYIYTSYTYIYIYIYK